SSRPVALISRYCCHGIPPYTISPVATGVTISAYSTVNSRARAPEPARPGAGPFPTGLPEDHASAGAEVPAPRKGWSGEGVREVLLIMASWSRHRHGPRTRVASP